MSSSSPFNPVPSLDPSPNFVNLNLPDSFSGLRRTGSHSSNRSGLVPSPQPSYTSLNEIHSAESSASGSRSGSIISTPRLISRGNSVRDTPTGSRRSASMKDKDARPEVIETLHIRMDRDPETGRKKINQYIVLHELGHGTHGRVRLAREVDDGGHEMSDRGNESYYASTKIGVTHNRQSRWWIVIQNENAWQASTGRDLAIPARWSTTTSKIRKEIAIFKKVNHPNVVRMHEIIDDPDSSKLYMVLEYCKNGEIVWKDGEGPALTVAETRRIFRQTLLGLEYLHHQGIIHRDIKPSNLLLSLDGTVKISDFGCSHYSEALHRAAHSETEGYVDDIELAKTAGSPAFFAPEMCYSGLEADTESGPTSPLPSPRLDLPGFTLRPPSVADEFGDIKFSRNEAMTGSRGNALGPTASRESSDSRPFLDRSSSVSSMPRRERLPITNAIDVWALGVTLYCLLFGKTPFEAANEYLLMQLIPVANVEYPEYLGRDRLHRDTDEGRACVDLLSCLLERDPKRRITLEQAKRHPFTLRDIPDPAAWLLQNDIHTQSFVTVSNDEVAGVVGGRGRLFEKVKRATKNLFTRDRSRSIGQDAFQPTAPLRQPSPSQAPPTPALVRRFSLLNTGAMSPRRHPSTAPSTSLPAASELHVNGGDQPITPPQSHEKLGRLSPPAQDRRPSVNSSTATRPRSPSSSNLGTRIVRMISRAGSQRSQHRTAKPATQRRISLEEVATRQRQSLETFGSNSSDSHVLRNVWESDVRHGGQVRRGSSLSEQFQNVEEEVDWNETLSDDEEDDTPSTAPPTLPNWHSNTLSGAPSRISDRLDDTPRPAHDEMGVTDDDGLAISVGSRRGRKASVRK